MSHLQVTQPSFLKLSQIVDAIHCFHTLSGENGTGKNEPFSEQPYCLPNLIVPRLLGEVLL